MLMKAQRLFLFQFKIYEQDPKEFIRVKHECYRDAFTNLNNVNASAGKHLIIA